LVSSIGAPAKVTQLLSAQRCLFILPRAVASW
jgi:hypothetical protein